MPDLVEQAFECVDVQTRQRLKDGFAFIEQALEHGVERVKPEHGVAALLVQGTGATSDWFAKQGLESSSDVVQAILAYLPRGTPAEPILSARRLTENLCSQELSAAFEELVKAADGHSGVLDELHLLGALLLHIDERIVHDFSKFGDVDLRCGGQFLLRRTPVQHVSALADDGNLRIEQFTARAWRALQVAQREAEDMGNSKVTALALWVSLLELPDSALSSVLTSMGCNVRRLLETSRELLKGTGPRRRTSLGLTREHVEESLIALINEATRSARFAGRELISEVDLAVVAVNLRPGLLGGLLSSLGIDAQNLRARLGAAREAGGEQQAQRLSFPPIEQVVGELRGVIVGQEEVIEALVPYLKRIRFGLLRRRSPAGVFLFVGPTGSGKTEMARQLARSLYGSEEALIFIEMGQLTTRESSSILTGAPPGYVGYGEGKLTNGLRDHPESVVLFDEVEKAHPEVVNVLLRFLDEGQVADPAGPVRDGRRCVVIITSNLLDDADIPPKGPIDREALIGKLRQRAPFNKAEIFGRLDAVLFFRSLDREHLSEIARRQLLELQSRLQVESATVLSLQEDVLEKVCDSIAAKSEELGQGARGVERIITTSVLSPLIDFLEQTHSSYVTASVPSKEGHVIEFHP